MKIKNVNIVTPPNVPFLRGNDLGKVEILKGVDISIERGIITKISTSNLNTEPNLWIIPGFVDSHTHSIFCGQRSDEIDLRKRIGYEGVLKMGGGIYRTVKETIKCTQDQLYEQSKERIETMIRNGTTTIEAKTGYGISPEAEGKMLNVMVRIEKELGIKVKKTLLAHVPPEGQREEDFIDLFREMIIGYRNVIDYVDVFVDDGAFTPLFARNVIEFANKMGIPGRIHLNEIKNMNGLAALRGLQIISFDHMLETREDEIEGIDGVLNFLPFTSLTLKKDPRIFESFRRFNKILALGSDISPNSYNLSLMMIIGLARQMTPFTLEELLNMATINSAFSLGLSGEIGSIHENKVANMIVLNSHYSNIGYIFGQQLVEEVFLNGYPVFGNMETNLIE